MLNWLNAHAQTTNQDTFKRRAYGGDCGLPEKPRLRLSSSETAAGEDWERGREDSGVLWEETQVILIIDPIYLLIYFDYIYYSLTFIYEAKSSNQDAGPAAKPSDVDVYV